MKWLLPVALLTVGCNQWEDADKYSYPVFSEDGAGIAGVFMTYEAKDTFTHTKTRNHSSQVVMKENTNSSAPAKLTPLMDGAVRDLFFMRDEGYIVLGRHGGETQMSDGSYERKIWYDIVDLDGKVTAIESGTYLSMLSCDGGTSSSSTAGPLRVIPSPDGSVLAKFEATSSCTERTMQVTFLDPSDLSVVDGPHDVADVAATGMGSTSFWATTDLGWTDEDIFSVGFWGTGTSLDHVGATQLEVSGDVDEEVETHMSCFYPPTTSSETNEDGETVEMDEGTGTVKITTASWGNVYGCDD
jgi:hypothetical protein